jgi:5-methylcytosine-specific restriction enzyme B
MPPSGVNVEVLDDVLEPFPDEGSNHGNFIARDLSFYRTEQRTLRQAASLVAQVRKGTWELDENHRRYFNTLRNNGILGEPADAPTLTPLSDIFYEQHEIAKGNVGSELTRDQERLLDRSILQYAFEQINAGNADRVSDHLKQVIRNIQDLFEQINPEQILEIIHDESLARRIQAINIEGSEPARYFRLPVQRRAEFDTSFLALLSLRDADILAALPENVRAYRDTARRLQQEVRIRVQDAFLAYRELKVQLGDQMPYLAVDLQAPRKNVVIARASRTEATSPLGPLQLIVSGCPGSGKSYWIDGRLTRANASAYRVQFHAELGFSEFVGSFKPRTLYEDTKTRFLTAGGAEFDIGRPVIDYAFAPGPFTDALVEAYAKPNVSVAIVIEEINRGNAAAAFGEIFQALDRDDGGRSRYPVVPQADYGEYLARNNALPDGRVCLPRNLYIWASMNGADQNVHPLDTAFRRRWSYRYMGYTEPCLYDPDDRVTLYGGQSLDWESFRGVLNETLIRLDVDEDKLIGPYFLSPRQLKDPDEVLNKLFLYLWDDAVRFRRSELFRDASFAKVGSRWAKGTVKALLLEIADVASVDADGGIDDVAATSTPPEPSALTAEGKHEPEPDS